MNSIIVYSLAARPFFPFSKNEIISFFEKGKKGLAARLMLDMSCWVGISPLVSTSNRAIWLSSQLTLLQCPWSHYMQGGLIRLASNPLSFIESVIIQIKIVLSVLLQSVWRFHCPIWHVRIWLFVWWYWVFVGGSMQTHLWQPTYYYFGAPKHLFYANTSLDTSQ